MDEESQDDEILALSSIFEENVFSASKNETYSGEFKITVDLPQNFGVVVKPGTGDKIFPNISIDHLPPIILNFELPPNYPSECSPTFTLTCKWLLYSQLVSLCEKLDALWEENKGLGILFTWSSFLRDETLPYLKISTELDITTFMQWFWKSKQNSKMGGPSHSSNNCAPLSRQSSNGSGTVPLSSRRSSGGSDDRSKSKHRAIVELDPKTSLMAALQDYNSAQNQEVFNKSLQTCNVCFSTKMGSDCIRFAGCEHAYCKECMKTHFEVLISERRVKALLCPTDKCNSEALPTQVRELVDVKLYAIYDSTLLNSTLASMTDVVFCPRVACQSPAVKDEDGKIASCPQCHFSFCPFCMMSYHGIAPCKIKDEKRIEFLRDYENASTEERAQMEQRYGKKQLQSMLDVLKGEEWVHQNSKRCPECASPIQKEAGCNKMTCQRCSSCFCYLCGMYLDKRDPYRHFRDVKSSCAGYLFYGVGEDGELELEDEDFDDWELGHFA